ncbi:hypothetical protein [Crystallibacter degradans]|uniref:hypothetical protein n=1 Tax=Crystallibacter degradans TaxID=2726743 RepID=UPI00147581EE|nr:hypothetical protein [Arthrobacter sp. SF27]NMR29932.1 hypothetical protein [Arthrobacter sp. SF27]
MAERTSDIRQFRARLARAHRRDSGVTPEELGELKRDYAAAKMAEQIGRLVNDSPPLTRAQRDYLAGLIQAAPVEAGQAA